MFYENNLNILKKDEDYDQIFNDYRDNLLNLVNSMINDIEVAEEIVQDVFLTFYSKGKMFEGRSSVYTWLYRITINRSIDYIRKKRRERKYSLKEYRSIEYQESHCESSINKIIILDALSKLKEDFRIPFIMAEYEHYSYMEISEKLNIPVNTVRTRIFRAREKLLKILKSMGVSL